MAKDKTLYTCNECGGSTPRWLGKCPHCSAWNSLVESVAEPAGGKNRFGSALAQGLAPAAEVTPLSQIEAIDVQRHPTGQEELDRVLGGGIVEGGVVLIGGDPGIGKSTLLLQALDGLQRGGMSTLYVTGEESGAQVALRSRRLGLDHSQVKVQADAGLGSQNAIGTGVLGGTISATVLGLFFVPLFYVMISKISIGRSSHAPAVNTAVEHTS